MAKSKTRTVTTTLGRRKVALLEKAREAEAIQPSGFALVAWDEKGVPVAFWDCGTLPPWSLPDFVRRVLENADGMLEPPQY